MKDLLHDKIDAREDLSSEAVDIIERVKAQFIDVFEASGGDIGRTMEALAGLAENELTDLTTKAVRMGFDHAKKLQGK